MILSTNNGLPIGKVSLFLPNLFMHSVMFLFFLLMPLTSISLAEQVASQTDFCSDELVVFQNEIIPIIDELKSYISRKSDEISNDLSTESVLAITYGTALSLYGNIVSHKMYVDDLVELALIYKSKGREFKDPKLHDYIARKRAFLLETLHVYSEYKKAFQGFDEEAVSICSKILIPIEKLESQLTIGVCGMLFESYK